MRPAVIRPGPMLTASQMTAQHARTQRKAPPKAMPQGTPLGRARAKIEPGTSMKQPPRATANGHT